MKHHTKTKGKAVAPGEAKARKALVLIAVKDGPYGSTLGRYLETDGYEVELCADARGVFRLASRKPFDIVVLDLELSDESGLELVTYIRRQLPEAKTILLFDVNRSRGCAGGPSSTCPATASRVTLRWRRARRCAPSTRTRNCAASSRTCWAR